MCVLCSQSFLCFLKLAWGSDYLVFLFFVLEKKKKNEIYWHSLCLDGSVHVYTFDFDIYLRN